MDSLAHTTLTRQYIYMSRLPNHDIWYAHYNLVGWVWKYTEILIVSKVIYSLYTLIFMVNLTCHHNKSFLANHTQSTLFSNFERFLTLRDRGIVEQLMTIIYIYISLNSGDLLIEGKSWLRFRQSTSIHKNKTTPNHVLRG